MEISETRRLTGNRAKSLDFMARLQRADRKHFPIFDGIPRTRAVDTGTD